MYKNIMCALVSIFSLSCVVPIFGIEATSDAQPDTSTTKAAQDNSTLCHKVINDWNNDHPSNQVVTEDMIARVKSVSAEMDEKRKARKIQQQLIRAKKLQKILEESTLTESEPVVRTKSLDSTEETRSIIHQQKEERLQANRACIREKRIKKAQEILAKATAMQKELDARAQAQGIDKNEMIKKGQDVLAKATAMQKEIYT